MDVLQEGEIIMYIRLTDVNSAEYLINFDYVAGIKLFGKEQDKYIVYVNNEDIQYIIVDEKGYQKIIDILSY